MKLRSVILAGFLLLWAAPAFSQGCAMCYGSAAATDKDGQKAVNKGVLVLLIPPMGFMTFGIWMAYRYSKMRDLEQQTTTPRRFHEFDLKLESPNGTSDAPATD